MVINITAEWYSIVSCASDKYRSTKICYAIITSHVLLNSTIQAKTCINK